MIRFSTAESAGTHSVRKDIKVCECRESRAPVLRQHRGSGLGSGQVDLSSVALIHKTVVLKSNTNTVRSEKNTKNRVSYQSCTTIEKQII